VIVVVTHEQCLSRGHQKSFFHTHGPAFKAYPHTFPHFPQFSVYGLITGNFADKPLVKGRKIPSAMPILPFWRMQKPFTEKIYLSVSCE
jgi:hypothetical protein